MVETITQKYLRRWPESKRAKSWLGVLVHIRTENGIWRPEGNGYTSNMAMAWVLPFEEAFRQVSHCGPEKRVSFISATATAERTP